MGPLDHYYGAGWYGPMGGAWVSAEDLARFAALLLNADPHAPFAAARSGMTEGILRTEYAPDVLHGHGLFLDESGPNPQWYHGGGVAGFIADMRVYPAAGAAVVILLNGDWDFPSETLYWAESTIGQWESTPEWGDLEITDVVGSYEGSGDLGTVRITNDGGPKIAFDATGDETELFSWDTDTGYFYYAPWQMEVNVAFWRDDSGVVDYLSFVGGTAARMNP
jgi:hypothetical protein